MNLQWQEVPPPKEAPLNNEADKLGLCVGLRAEKGRYGQWRCSCCNQMQRGGDWEVLVPDSVMRGDPDWGVTEACRKNAYNGNFSAWCISCAKKLGGRSVKDVATTWAKRERPWWKFW